MRTIACRMLAGVTIGALLIAGCGGSGVLDPGPVRQDVSSLELEAMMGDGQPLVILDVRTAGEYQARHIPGSVNIPVAELAARLGELDAHLRTVCVCTRGVRSVQGSQVLLDSGFTRVYNLEDGLQTWQGPWQP